MSSEKWIKAIVILLNLLLLLLEVSCSARSELANQPVDYNLQSASLYRAFIEEETISEQKYVGKVLQVIGTIKKVIPKTNGTIVLVLETNDAGAIHCDFSQGDAPALSSIQVGNTIQVKGVCDGFSKDVVLKNCLLMI